MTAGPGTITARGMTEDRVITFAPGMIVQEMTGGLAMIVQEMTARAAVIAPHRVTTAVAAAVDARRAVLQVARRGVPPGDLPVGLRAVRLGVHRSGTVDQLSP